MDIRMEQYYGDDGSWRLTFISEGFEFTPDDLVAVRCAVERPGRPERDLPPLDQLDRRGGGLTGSYRGGWNRRDGRQRTNRISVSCTIGQRPGPTAWAYRVLKERYPSARFTTGDDFLREKLNQQGLSIVAP